MVQCFRKPVSPPTLLDCYILEPSCQVLLISIKNKFRIAIFLLHYQYCISMKALTTYSRVHTVLDVDV